MFINRPRPDKRFAQSLGCPTSRPRRGAVTTEFAFVLPIFLLLTFASIEFSNLNTLRHVVNNAAYEAARVGIVPGASATDVLDSATNYLQTAVNAKGSTVTVTPNPITPETTEVTVDIAVPVDQNAWVLPKFSGGRNITATSKLRTERYRGIEVPEEPPPPPPDDDDD